MNKLENLREGLTFDDVLLMPQYSDIKSRSCVDISTNIGDLKISVPILSANMDSITGLKMSKAMWGAGGLGILHRYAPKETIYKWLMELIPSNRWPSIGIKDDDLKSAELYRSLTDNICIDIAHGNCEAMQQAIKHVKSIGYKNIMAGNVADSDGAITLVSAGANIIKVGIGPGSVCTTRLVTGHGVPQLTAVADIAHAFRHKPTVTIIADGGIKNSGDAVKALAAGAHAVMIGGLLAGTDEAEMAGVYRGMASSEAQIAYKGSVSNNTAEGIAKKVQPKGPVADLINQFAGGIKSGCSYSGCSTLELLRKYAKFIRVTNNCLIENGTR